MPRRPSLSGVALLALAVPARPQPQTAPASAPAWGDALRAAMAQELTDRRIPAVMAAVADQDRILWRGAVGLADPDHGVAATPATVIRAGSVSKLFTDVLAMRLSERGQLDLDRPVRTWLPGFTPRPHVAGEPEITLRHLMSHRAGLVREPARGHYFDPEPVSLAEVVQSLVASPLVHSPGARFKYSNAGVTVVGAVLAAVTGQEFGALVDAELCRPLGLDSTAFQLTPALRERLASARMWTYDGRVFPAPTFALGTAPAGNLYSTVEDLARFAASWGTPHGPLRPDTFTQMWQPQAGEAGRALGFFTDQALGTLRVGHAGAVYGFATQVSALPAEGLAVAVCTTLDCANGVSARIATRALELALAARRNLPPPAPRVTTPVGRELAERRAGTYQAGTDVRTLLARGEDLVVLGPTAQRVLRATGPDRCIVDDVQGTGGACVFTADGQLTWNGVVMQRIAAPRPAPCPDPWRPLLGEYGWDYDVLFVLERAGRLTLLVEWFEYTDLAPAGSDFVLPGQGLYAGEPVRFVPGPDGAITAVEIGAVRFPRRPGPQDGSTFRITPRRPVDELRAAAARAVPPANPAGLRAPDLVELRELVPGLRYDIRYAGRDNFMGAAFYTEARARLQRPAAAAVARAQETLAAQGLGLLIHDAWRPWQVTWMFWEGTPEHLRQFVADPSKGSRHNRGCAVDLTLCDGKTGQPVEMVSGYDEFTERAYPDYPGGTSLGRWHRELLRAAMSAQGFTVYEHEWWHFDFKDWRSYPVQ